MLKLRNMGPSAFRKYCKDKYIYLYGAGRALYSCFDIYFFNISVEAIIDNSKSKWGREIVKGEKSFFVKDLEWLKNELKYREKEKCIIFITSPYYAAEIVEQLDRIEELDNIECFFQIAIRNSIEKYDEITYSLCEAIIPPKIHYIWFGDTQLPDEYKKNIETWHKYNPEYEIIRWDESNYNIKKNDFLKQSYKHKKWSFMSNYARLDIINQEGGIYLDTDVEVVGNFDKLRRNKTFICMGTSERINMGCGFGSEENSKFIQDIMHAMEESRYLDDNNQYIEVPFNSIINPIARRYGFRIENRYQEKGGICLYPREVMSPRTVEGLPDDYTKNTVSIHKESGTWLKEKERIALRKTIKMIKNRMV